MPRSPEEIAASPISYTLGGEPDADFTIHVRERDFSMSLDDAKRLFSLMFTGGFATFRFAEEGARALYLSTFSRARSDVRKGLAWLLDDKDQKQG
jgi:hypothetical protein